MFHIVLFEPEIPPNTGNIIRLCANTGSFLHLVEPLGFDLDDKKLRRAGLDYREWASIRRHDSLQAFIDSVRPRRLIGCSTTGGVNYETIRYQPMDALIFGPETRGLPQTVKQMLAQDHHLIRIPMVSGSRSLNLSNAVAVVLYEAWRQNNFDGNA